LCVGLCAVFELAGGFDVNIADTVDERGLNDAGSSFACMPASSLGIVASALRARIADLFGPFKFDEVGLAVGTGGTLLGNTCCGVTSIVTLLDLATRCVPVSVSFVCPCDSESG
jgi:hypothetical protein